MEEKTMTQNHNGDVISKHIGLEHARRPRRDFDDINEVDIATFQRHVMRNALEHLRMTGQDSRNMFVFTIDNAMAQFLDQFDFRGFGMSNDDFRDGTQLTYLSHLQFMGMRSGDILTFAQTGSTQFYLHPFGRLQFNALTGQPVVN
jgi:hypothetical protein